MPADRENRREIGAYYESLALSYLEGQGAEPVERNFRCRQGEIDLIYRHEGYLVFAEVKFRTNEHMGDPLEAVDRRKQRTISRVCDRYRFTRHLPEDTPIRFDVIGIESTQDGPARICWVRDAFPYIFRKS